MKYVTKCLIVICSIILWSNISFAAITCNQDCHEELSLAYGHVFTNSGWEFDNQACANYALDACVAAGAQFNVMNGRSEGDPTPDGCYICGCWEESNCTTWTVWIRCPAITVEVSDVLSDIVTGTAVVTGVTQGGERAAAELWASSWFAANPYPSAPAGHVRTDGAKGLSYSSSLNVDENLVDVSVTAWKRSQFTAEGATPIPLIEVGQAGSGGGSGGTDSGVSSAGSPKGTTGDPLKVSTGGPKGTAEDPLHAVGGLTAAEMQALLNPNTQGFTAPDAPAAGDFLFAQGDVDDLKDNFTSSASSTFNTFLTDAKETDFGGLVGSFFGSMPTTAEDTPVLTWDAGERFGTHEIDFATYTTFFAILRTLVIFVCTFISIRNIFLKGGSG